MSQAATTFGRYAVGARQVRASMVKPSSGSASWQLRAN